VSVIRAGVNVSDNTYKSRVLIVDDEQNIANTLAMVFKIKGHEALAVYNAESAVEAIETFEPDVVLSDVIMGKMAKPIHPEKLLEEINGRR
jgi:DNA-binding NtrC family response regulator